MYYHPSRICYYTNRNGTRFFAKTQSTWLGLSVLLSATECALFKSFGDAISSFGLNLVETIFCRDFTFIEAQK